MVYVDEEIAIDFSIHCIYAHFPYRYMSLETRILGINILKFWSESSSTHGSYWKVKILLFFFSLFSFMVLRKIVLEILDKPCYHVSRTLMWS